MSKQKKQVLDKNTAKTNYLRRSLYGKDFNYRDGL